MTLKSLPFSKETYAVFALTLVLSEYIESETSFDISEEVCKRYPGVNRKDVERIIEIYHDMKSSEKHKISDADSLMEIIGKLHTAFISEKSKADMERDRLETIQLKTDSLNQEIRKLRSVRDISETTPVFLSEEAIAERGSFDTLTDHDRKAYYYWRTQIRNGNIIETPRLFIRLYLYSIALFVEYNTVEDSITAMKKLISAYQNNRLVTYDINYYLDRFITFYGTEEDVEKYISEGVAGGYAFNPYLPNEVKEEALLHGDYTEALSILSIGAHKIKESPVYRNPELKDSIDQEFPEVLRSMVDYFASRDIDLMQILAGSFFDFTKHTEDPYIHPIRDRIYEKTIYSDYGDLVLQVTKDTITMRRFRQHALRTPLRNILLRMYDNNLRERFGIKRKLKINLDTIAFRGGNPNDAEDVEKVYQACASSSIQSVFP